MPSERDLWTFADFEAGGARVWAPERDPVSLNPLMKRVHTDAPARHGTASRLADERACLLRPAVHRPAFRTFTMLAYGFLAQTGKRTVCGMLAGAGLSRL